MESRWIRRIHPTMLSLAALLAIASLVVSLGPNGPVAEAAVSSQQPEVPFTPPAPGAVLPLIPSANAPGILTNSGQIEASARYYSVDPHSAVYFEPKAIWVDRALDQDRRIAVRVDFPNATRDMRVEAEELLPARGNVFRGDDPRAWRTNLEVYAAVRYRGMAPGADALYRIEAGRLKYDVILAPGADLSRVSLRYRGAQSLEIGPGGSLLLHAANGVTLQEEPPVLYQERPGRRVPIRGGYRVLSTNEIGFWATGYDPSLPLIVDPGMMWSTFVGGAAADYLYAVASDGGGNIYVTGYTNSTDYPTTPGAYQTGKGSGADAIVTKMSSDGSRVVWSTFLGGAGSMEYGHAIAVDGNGNVYVAGATNSTNFPVTAGAFRTTHGGGQYDAFVSKLSASGSSLVFSTYLGGNYDEYALGITVDGSGNPIVAGLTSSTTFPTTAGVVKPSRSGTFPDASDGFLSKLNAAGSGLVFSTYVGAEGGSDAVYGLAVDASGRPTVVGFTASPGFPVTASAFDRTFACCREGFVTQLNATATGYVFSTFIGKLAEDLKDIELYSVAFGTTGGVYVTGHTNSTNYPTTAGARQRSYGGGTYDAVVLKLASDGRSLAYSSYLGGGGDDDGYGIAVSQSGGACVTGSTDSNNFPTTSGAYDVSANGGVDAFLSMLAPDGGSLAYSSYLGSSGADYGLGITLNQVGMAAVAGISNGSFPTTAGAYDRTPGGGGQNDGFVALLDIGAGSTTAVEGSPIPPFHLVGPSPSPFSGSSAISLTLDSPAEVGIRVYSVSGRMVRDLAQSTTASGFVRYSWDGRDTSGQRLPSGIYYVEVRIANRLADRRSVVLLR
jgi:hypothetical protein